MERNKFIHLVWPPLLVYLVYLLSKLVWFDSLSSLANDSVHYLAMARHYSPWVSESIATASVWPLQDFPPLFPWLLALSGAAHSLLYAHLLVAGLGLASLLIFYFLSKHWLKNTSWAIFSLLVLALSPGFILGLQGILSESLYLSLVLIFMLLYRPAEKNTSNQIVIASLLLGAILLTRTVGIALCMAILAQAFFSSISNKKIHYHSILIVAISLSIYFILMSLWGPVKDSHYFEVVLRYLAGDVLYELGTDTSQYFSFKSQVTLLLNSWSGFWILSWRTDVFSATYFITLLLLLASLSGLLIRLYKNKYDAWYVLFFILILLLWPHPGQMFRLIFPVAPILLIYAAHAVNQLAGMSKNLNIKKLAPFVFYIVVLSAILPSHIFIHTRQNYASERQMIPVYEMLIETNSKVARKTLVIENQILKDLTKVRESVPKDEIVMYFMPSYLAVLSDRQGVKAPSPVNGRVYRKIAKDSGARYIFLSQLHPRNTRPGYNGFAGVENLDGWAKPVWCSRLKNGHYATCLFMVLP